MQINEQLVLIGGCSTLIIRCESRSKFSKCKRPRNTIGLQVKAFPIIGCKSKSTLSRAGNAGCWRSWVRSSPFSVATWGWALAVWKEAALVVCETWLVPIKIWVVLEPHQTQEAVVTWVDMAAHVQELLQRGCMQAGKA